jgi:hypothetical protein
MKSFYTYLLQLSIILFCITVDSCKPKSDSANINPTPTNTSQTRILLTTDITDNNSNLGAIVTDSVSKDIFLLYGKKDVTGALKSITEYGRFEESGHEVLVKITPNTFFPLEYTARSNEATVKFTLLRFDSATNTVDLDIIDNRIKKAYSIKSVKLDTKTAENLSLAVKLYTNNLKGARLASVVCSLITVSIKVTELVDCVLSSIISYVVTIANPYGGDPITKIVYERVTEDCDKAFTEYVREECRVYEPKPNFVPCIIASGAMTVFGVSTGLVRCVNDVAQLYLQILSNGQSTGDPHLTTADNFHYSFQGWGEFIAVKSTVDNFEVQVRQEDVNNTKSATVNTALGIQTGTDIVSATVKPFNIYVNEQIQNLSSLPIPLKNGASISKIRENGRDTYLVTTVNKDAVKMYLGGSNSLDYSLFLNSNRKGKITGLFGNFDGDGANDLKIRDGKIIEYSFDNLYPTFTDSWRIDAQPNHAKLLYYESGKDTKSYTVRGFPASPTALAAQNLKDAETTCRNAGLTSEPYLSNCIFDVAVTNDQSFAKSALWNQQNNPSTGIPYGSDIDEIKNVRVTISDDPITQNDSCFVSYRTGKVFRVKDGAAHATEIDGFFSYYCGINMFKAARVLQGGGGLFAEMRNQKWSNYRDSPVEYEGFLREDNPSDPNKVDAALWNYIKTTADIRNSFYSLPKLITNTDQIGETNVINASQGCTPDGLMNKTLRRFRTQEGKLGVIRFTNWGKTATGWWLTMDIKIQK